MSMLGGLIFRSQFIAIDIERAPRRSFFQPVSFEPLCARGMVPASGMRCRLGNSITGRGLDALISCRATHSRR